MSLLETEAVDILLDPDEPRDIVISGPSGTGKSAFISQLTAEFPSSIEHTVSHTTRIPRKGEFDGKQYHFVTKPAMEAGIKNGEFIQSIDYCGNLYGTSKAAVECIKNKEKICIFDVTTRGARDIRNYLGDRQTLLVFIKTPSLEVLKTRLRKRGTDTDEEIECRLAAARQELDDESNFDRVVVNDIREDAFQALKDIVLLEIRKLEKKFGNA